MAFLYNIPEDPIPHHYKTFFESLEIQNEACQRASTVYVGNFIWNTTKEQLFYYFSSVGNVKNVYMGLDKNKYQPCGFAFVVYETPEEADYAVKVLNESSFNGTIIKVERDWGFSPDRQYARGKNGCQVSDEVSGFNYDSNNGRQRRYYGENRRRGNYRKDYNDRGSYKRYHDYDQDNYHRRRRDYN